MRWSMPWLVICTCCVPAASTTSWPPAAQEANLFAVHSWDIENGLPSSVVRAVVQTDDGYLWVGTEDGLARFDGLRFRVFNSANTPELKTNSISTLFNDRAGRLWIGDEGGGLTRFNAGRFDSLPLANAVRLGRIAALAEDGVNGLWIAGECVIRFADGTERLVTQRTPAAGSPAVANHADDVWVAAGMDLVRFETGPGQALQETARLAGVRPDLLCSTPGGELWVASQDRVRKLGGEVWQADFTLYREIGETWRRLVTALYEDTHGGLWIGTYGGGVFYLTDQDPPARVATQGALSQNVITCFHEDREGSIWVGTDGGGLHRITRRPLHTLFLPPPYSQHIFQTLCFGRDGSIWAGTDGAGLFRFQAGDPVRLAETEGLPGLHVTSVFEDQRARVWVGTTRGLFVGDGHHFGPAHRTSGLTAPVLALFEDRAGQLWLGTGTGVARIRDGDLEIFPKPENPPDVRAFAEDVAGNLWVATMNTGLNRFVNGQLVRHQPVESLSSNVRALLADADGSLWIGTFGDGLARLRMGTLTVFTVNDGLANGIIHAMVDDGAGRLWLSSDDGIFALNKLELDQYVHGKSKLLSCIRLSVRDGLTSRRGSGSGQPVAGRSPSGQLWIPNMRALVVLDPGAAAQPVPPLQVVIEEATIDNHMQPLDFVREIRMPWGTRQFTCRYTALSLARPEAVLFRYQLEGFDEDWVEGGLHRVAYYGQLPAGQYRFRVMASGGDGNWHEARRSLALHVVPRFWQTWWFHPVWVLTLAATITGAARHFSQRKLRRAMAQLELQSAVEAERGRIARDIHDDLGARLTEIVLMSDPQHAEFAEPSRIQSHLERICGKTRSVLQTLSQIVWTVNPRNDSLPKLLDYCCVLSEELCEASGIRCWHDTPAVVPELPLKVGVRHDLILAVKEALHNVLKHAGATEVWLRLTVDPHRLQIRVEDNGRGFVLNQAGPAGNGSGNGLRNMRERLLELGGQAAIDTAPGQGTRVTFVLPLKAG